MKIGNPTVHIRERLDWKSDSESLVEEMLVYLDTSIWIWEIEEIYRS